MSQFSAAWVWETAEQTMTGEAQLEFARIGGADLAADAIAEDLIDEYRQFGHPVPRW
jgi:monoamine oxidase